MNRMKTSTMILASTPDHGSRISTEPSPNGDDGAGSCPTPPADDVKLSTM
jgi:hypothetical protein